MAYRLIHLHVSTPTLPGVDEVKSMPEVRDFTRQPQESGGFVYHILTRTEELQAITDRICGILGKTPYQMSILPVETVLPKPPAPELVPEEKKKTLFGISREELYDDVERGAVVNTNFIWLTIFSTVVAAIGLLENNVAVVIGAMVIAPLLGPNIALALASALGDIPLLRRAIVTNLTGVTIALLISIGVGMFWPGPLDSPELLSRTDVGFDGIILAIVAGAAGVLSLTSGVPSVLVGVMVAVALLPPAVTLGVFLGVGNFTLAMGAGLLLAVNVVCVNLAAKFVFLFKGIRPRSWYQQQQAKAATRWSMLFWIISLLLLMGVIILRSRVELP
ncbi:MAG: TIGR00341 family protein [Hyphomicrobiales bacterium]|nr:TIGR00341 family protein [Hyphomicrobiales bacterium]